MNLQDQGVLIVGATSSIARSLANQLAAAGAKLHLAGRDTAEVERIARDLQVRHQVPVSFSGFEALAYETHSELVQRAIAGLGELVGVVVCLGELGTQAQAEIDFAHAQQIIDSNYTGAASVLTHAANHLEQQGRGFIIGITSVAGDRGRQSNYVYGSAKGALSLFLQGLRQRLHKSGVQVLTVKPGYVDTKMTYGLLNSRLVAAPESLWGKLEQYLNRNRAIVYLPWFWQIIMKVIVLIPEGLFKRLKL